jgi:hypothetical protein
MKGSHSWRWVQALHGGTRRMQRLHQHDDNLSMLGGREHVQPHKPSWSSEKTRNHIEVVSGSLRILRIERTAG